MKTRERVTATHVEPIDVWCDAVGREVAWRRARKNAAEIAAARCLALADDGMEDRHVLFTRTVIAHGGDSSAVECPESDAEFVRIRLSVWAQSR